MLSYVRDLSFDRLGDDKGKCETDDSPFRVAAVALLRTVLGV